MASATPLDDTEEKCNGTKLARLLMDGGTATVRHTFDTIHAPTKLQAALHTNQSLLTNLRKKRVLNSSQWDLLYPPSGTAPDSKTFDITLLFVLLRNICGLTTPATGWDVLPHAADVSREANLARIKYYRNQVYAHVSSTEVSNTDFEQYWNDIAGAMIALGADPAKINSLKFSFIGETNYLNLLNEWMRADSDVKEMVHTLGSKIQRLDATVQNLGDKMQKQIPLVETLSQCDFTLHKDFLVSQFQEGTRTSILDKIRTFYESNPDCKSRALMITALPGVGKSVLAAVACRHAQEKGCLAACHFLQHNNSQRNNPRIVIESIAHHLCESIEGFKEALDCKLSSMNKDVRQELNLMNLETLITVLLEEPLGKVVSGKSPENTFVVVIDAFDECETSARDEFLNTLLSKLRNMPKWIKFVLTSRPTRKSSIELPYVTVVNIDTTDLNNTEDIRLYLSNQLQLIYPDERIEKREAVVATLTTKSAGIFLYTHFVSEAAKSRDLSIAETNELFPNGISSVYTDYLSRSKIELNLDEERFFNFLEAVAAARAPLPESLVFEILGINHVSRQGKAKARKTLKSLSLLFPIEAKHVAAFHKSLVDWLIKDDDDEEDQGSEFTVKVEDGHRVLAEHCLPVLRAVKNHPSFPPELNDLEKFALTFGFHHMLEAGGYKEQLGECVHDLELLSAKWVVRGRNMLNELMDINKCYSVFVEDIGFIKDNLLWLLHRLLVDYPHIFLQLAAYCPDSTAIKSRAVSLLSSPKYRNYLWIEKHEFYSLDQDCDVVSVCSSDHTIACLYKSPHSRYLVTLSREGREQLASVDLSPGSFLTEMTISPCDKYIVSYICEVSKQIEVRDLKTLKKQRTFKVESGNLVLSCCFVTANKLAAGCDDRTVRVWDVESGALETTLQCIFGSPDICVASPAGGLLTVEVGTVVLWRSLTQPVPEKLLTHVKFLRTTPIVAFSPDGSLLACCCGEGRLSCVNVIKVFNITTSQLLKNFSAGDGLMISLLFIDDSHFVLRRFSHTDVPLKVVAVRSCVTQAHSVESKFIYHHRVLERRFFIPKSMTKANTLYTLKFHM